MAAGILAGCGKKEKKTEDPAAVSEETRHGPVTASITVKPGKVSLDRRAILTLRVTYPRDVKVQIPALSDRVEGFVAGHSFEKTSSDSEGNTTVEKVARLTPLVADEYRIAPVPVVYYISNTAGQKKNWFPTPPLRLEAEFPKTADSAFKEFIDPVWIRPSAKELSIGAVAVIAFVLLLLVIIKLIRKLCRHVRLLRMSPRERALEELRMLLEKDLVSRERVKEFYMELTMIVRLFIERGYGIRAPEQTTEEFLESASEDKRFTPRVLEKLRSFLQSADLVKFAGFKPDSDATNAAVESARNFIRTESSENPDAGRKQEVNDA